MKRERKFIKFLSEAGEKMVTVDASDRRAAAQEVNRAANKNSAQLKKAERADADKEKAEAKAEENPQLRALKQRRANMQAQMAGINDQISRIEGNGGER